MANYRKVGLLFLVLAVTLASAEPPRFRPQRRFTQQSRRVPARQQVAPPAPLPYPSADELKPAVPFHEEEAAQPDEVYGPPDQTYGPPDQTYGPPPPPAEQLPSAEAAPEFAPNPDAEEFVPQPARLVARRQRLQKIVQQQQQRKQRLQGKTKTVVNSQRLVATAAAPAPAPPAPVPVPVPVAVSVQPAAALPKLVINSQRLVAAAAPVAVAVPPAPLSQSYVVINSPFAHTEYYQSL